LRVTSRGLGDVYKRQDQMHPKKSLIWVELKSGVSTMQIKF
jgi:hypothetical protein